MTTGRGCNLHSMSPFHVTAPPPPCPKLGIYPKHRVTALSFPALREDGAMEAVFLTFLTFPPPTALRTQADRALTFLQCPAHFPPKLHGRCSVDGLFPQPLLDGLGCEGCAGRRDLPDRWRLTGNLEAKRRHSRPVSSSFPPHSSCSLSTNPFLPLC